MAAILADDNFKCIFLNENDRIPIRISLHFVPKSPINNKPAFVQVMAWRRTGNKPLPELMLTPVYWRIYAALGGDELITSDNGLCLTQPSYHNQCWFTIIEVLQGEL